VQFCDINAMVDPSLGIRKSQRVILPIIIICQWIFIVPVFQGTLFQIQNADAQELEQQQQDAKSDSCIIYDSTENAIRINCESANLTYIYNQLQDPDLLQGNYQRSLVIKCWYNN